MAALQFVVIAILLGIGSVMDIRTREIPNWISAGVLISAFFHFNIQNFWGIIVAVIFFSVALATGKIGGGDVKLIAALSMVCGLWGSFALLLFAQTAMLLFYAGYCIFCKINGKTADKAPGGSFCLPFVPFIFIGYLASKLIF